DAVPNHQRGRRGLARLYWSELQRARQRGAELDEVAYEQLLREVDDGTYVRELAASGALEVTIGAHATRVTLAKLDERHRRLGAAAGELLDGAVTRSLPAGRYVVTAQIGAGPATASWPVNIEPGTACKVAVDPPPPGVIAAAEVYVPAGPARLGGDPLSTE